MSLTAIDSSGETAEVDMAPRAETRTAAARVDEGTAVAEWVWRW